MPKQTKTSTSVDPTHRQVDVSMLELPVTVLTVSGASPTRHPPNKRAKRSVGNALISANANSSLNPSVGSAANLHQTVRFPALLNEAEPRECTAKREKMAFKGVAEMRKKMKAALRDANQAAFSRVLAFVSQAHAEDASVFSSRLPFKELPVALILGNSPSLHEGMASRFLETPRRFHFAVLHPMNSADIKNCIKAIAVQLMFEQPADGEEQQSEDDTQSGGGSTQLEKMDEEMLDMDLDELELLEMDKGFVPSNKKRKPLPYDIRALKAWFAMQPRERNSTGIVVSIPDFERFDNAVFSHLVKVCSSCMEEMPFTFLLGISTTLDILHNNYDKSVIRLLRCERFNLSKSDESVDAIISEIFLKDPCGIKLDHDAFSQVFSNYWHNHKSLDALGDALEFTLMTHLYGNAHSVCMTDENSGSVYYPELLNRFRWMQSYQDYVNDIAKKEDFEEVERLTNDDYHLIALIEKSKLDLLEYHAFQVLGVELLRSTKRLLKLNNLNSLYFAYSSLLSTYDFVQEKVVQEVVRRLKAIKVSELISIVIHWIQALESYESPLVHSTPPLEREIAELKAHIATFESKHKPKLRDFDDSDSSDEEARIRANEKHVPTSARKTRSAQKAGLEMPLFVEKGGLMFFAASVAGSFERILRKLTKHYTSVLFHEIYYYRDYKLLIKAFQPQPRPIIQMALGAPSDYLACRCCEANAPLNSNSLDMSIVYRLHQECGHMINLFDLFTAFELVVGKEKPTPSRTSLQARFSACLTQLEFLGFIKPTMRKTDHVLKMTASFL